MRTQWTPIAIALLLSVGCNDDTTAPSGSEEETGILVRFEVFDTAGVPSRSFSYGDEMCFEIEVVNATGADQTWRVLHPEMPGASVSFLSGELYESNFDSEALGLQNGVLQSGESVRFEFTTSEGAPPVAVRDGIYEVLGRVHLRFDELLEIASPQLRIQVLPPAGQTTRIVSVAAQPGMGFCPDRGLFEAVVFADEFGNYTMEGTRLLEAGWGYDLAKEAFPPVALSEGDARTLDRLVAEFPRVTPQIDGACDPCLQYRYGLPDGDRLIWLVCVNGPQEYLDHQTDLWTFLSARVPR